jgi:hypothetical protein
MKMKFASLLVAAVEFSAVVYAGSVRITRVDFSEGMSGTSAACILFGLLCIWLADYLGAFTGSVGRSGYVDSPTPAVMFVVLGWIFLCVPLAILAYAFFASPKP